jgi:triphosphatase
MKAQRSRLIPPSQKAPSRAVSARPVDLDPGMSAEQALGVILTASLQQLRDNEAGVASGTDPECVHQMRVGLRRLLSALRAFKPWIAQPEPWLDDLGWLGLQLGSARDADVLADSTLVRVVQACPSEAAWWALMQAATLDALFKRQGAAAAVGSARYLQLMHGLQAWVHDAGWRQSCDEAALAALAEPVTLRATQILAHCHHRLLKRSRHMLKGTQVQRHRIRIAAKQARYAAEFFQSLNLESGKRYIQVVQALQADLGLLNDAVVARRLLRSMATQQPGVARGAALARAYLAESTHRGVRALGKRLKDLRKLKATKPLASVR